jgi:hypothetical protein
VQRKGGAIDIIVWPTGGPACRCRPATSTSRARLSYTHAEALFKAASGAATLHQLRHSALHPGASGGSCQAEVAIFATELPGVPESDDEPESR